MKLINFFAAEFRKNTGQTMSEGGGVVTRRQVKKVISLHRAMTKKRSAVFL